MVEGTLVFTGSVEGLLDLWWKKDSRTFIFPSAQQSQSYSGLSTSTAGHRLRTTGDGSQNNSRSGIRFRQSTYHHNIDEEVWALLLGIHLLMYLTRLSHFVKWKLLSLRQHFVPNVYSRLRKDGIVPWVDVAHAIHLILVLSVERIGRKVGFFTWGLQPKREQHIGGIFEREGTRLLSRRRRVPEASLVLIHGRLMATSSRKVMIPAGHNARNIFSMPRHHLSCITMHSKPFRSRCFKRF